MDGNSSSYQGYSIPPPLSSPFSLYPNPLELTKEDRREFHPVVKFPADVDGKLVYRILDHTIEGRAARQVTDSPGNDPVSSLATEQERQDAAVAAAASGQDSDGTSRRARSSLDKNDYAIGRYDEDRQGMYSSNLFAVQDEAKRRTIHVGIDLDGPLYTPVYAFWEGTVHAAGYNAELGDYGNVVVVKHSNLPSGSNKTIYALYGHLDGSISWKPGDAVQRGQQLGRMGDIHENGGWYIPHVHFQLSLHPPETHDLPGVVSRLDRPKALVEYPDPRHVLGDLY